MKLSLTILLLTTLGFYSCGQNVKSTTNNDRITNYVEITDSIVLDENIIKIDTFSSGVSRL